jgi:type IV pilus assembly protein PilM
MAAQVCWGVEVGAGALKAVKLERSGENDVTVADFVILPHKKVLSTPEVNEDEAKRVAIGQFINEREVKKVPLAISVPGATAFARFAKLPPVEPKKIPDIVKFEAVQQIPFPIDDVEWDYQTFVAPDTPEVEAGIFAMTRERVNQKLARWQDVGLTPEVLTLSSLAAYNALAFDLNFDMQMPGTIIMDVGTTSTDLIVCEPGRMWIRTFPIGGHQFTEALVSAFNISYGKAEKLKKEAENAQVTRQVLQALRPVFGDLAADVQRSIQYYQSLHRDAKLTRLIGLGSTFNLPGLRKFLSQQVQIEVEKLEGFRRLKMEGDRNTEFQAAALNLTTAAGLALQGLGLQTLNANLMPLPVIREAVWSRKTKWFATAAALALAAGGAAFIRPVLDRAAVASTPRPPEIDQVKNEAKALKAKWGEVEAAAKPDAAAAAAMVLFESRDIFPAVLFDVNTMIANAAARKTSDGRPGFSHRSLNLEYRTAKPAGGPSATAPAEGESKPHVHVVLEVQTSHPQAEADRMVNDLFQRWLEQNAVRADRPFHIDPASVKWTMFQRDPVTAAGVQEGGGTGRDAPRRPSRPRGGGGGEVVSESGGGGGGGGGGARMPGASDLDALAPVPKPALPAPPGSFILNYRIEWDAYLGQPPKPEGAEGEQPAEKAP